MGKYIFKRFLHGLFSVVCVVILVMILIYSLMDRDQIFAGDATFVKAQSNQRETYKQTRWEMYGYVDYVTFADYLNTLTTNGEIDEETRAAAVTIGRTAENDSELTAEYVAKFTEHYESQGYDIIRLDAQTNKRGRLVNGGAQVLFATRDKPLLQRVWKYFTGILVFDNVHKVPEDQDIGERKLTFTWYDPAKNPGENGEKVFSPAILGNGTTHKYLLYFDNQFPYIHQNFLTIKLGVSYSVNQGVDVFQTMVQSQGPLDRITVTYPTGLIEESADDLHTATYMAGSRTATPIAEERYTDDYANVISRKSGMSKMGYSFVIGIISTIMSYILGLPIGLAMALFKDKLVDKLGTIYIIFIIAVPSLAYIFLFKGIGGKLGLPTLFDVNNGSKAMYILPIVSLALPSVAGLMKWMRRYMIDQMNSDYVKFARSGGLSEGEIFSKHIWKNAIIPITHGIPGSIIFSITGAIITERVYSVPGAGNLLNDAIGKYDNGVIVGVTMFYALLSIISLILGDVLMSMVDPRISFTEKAR